MGLARLSSPPGSKKAYILDNSGFLAQDESNTQTRIVVSPNETDGKFVLLNIIHAGQTTNNIFHEGLESPTALYVVKGSIRLCNAGNCQHVSTGDFMFTPKGMTYDYTVEEPAELLVFFICPEHGKSIFCPDERIAVKAKGTLNQNTTGDSSSVAAEPGIQSFNTQIMTEVGAPTPDSLEPYLLRYTPGQRWAFGGFLTKPLLRQTMPTYPNSISLMESTTRYPERPFVDRWVCFTNVHHCFYVLEGHFKFKVKGDAGWSNAEVGQSFFVPARTFFIGDVASETARLIVFANGQGVDEMVVKAGYAYEGLDLPETIGKWDGWDEARVKSACAQLGAQIE